MNQTLFCLKIIISFCVVACGVADYISDTTDIFSTTNPSDSSFTFCGGNDWIAYKDEKCFKIIKTSATHDEAEIICNQDFRTDSVAPTLVSIKSAAEQEYLTKFVFEISGVEDNVWIGARRLENSNEFVWNDGSFINDFFDNFAVGSPTVDDRRGCVAMQSELSKQSSNMSDLDQRAINGKWKDVSCNTKNLILCQKMQTWSLQHLQKTFLDFKKELKDSLKDVTNQLSDTRNQLDDTKNELTNTKNELSSTKNDLTTTKNELTNTKNELTATKNELTNTKNELTATKNELTNTQNELTATKNELTNTKNELTAIKNELTNTKNELTTTTNNLNTHLGDVKNKLEVLQKNPIPIGFIYVQLPDQPEPWDLWGSVDWTEITSQYAGLFFRVLGGGSAHFWETQAENAPRIVKIEQNQANGGCEHCVRDLNVGSWSGILQTGVYHSSSIRNLKNLNFYTSGGEIRPRNRAVRVWKRTN